jgi:hypothetical protein
VEAHPAEPALKIRGPDGRLFLAGTCYPKLLVTLSGNFQGVGTIVRIAAIQFEHGEEDFFAMLAEV